jgi:hypothetical protein
MHDVFPKFIVEGNNLIIAKCTYHKDLVTDKEQVKGGGWWKFDTETKTFTLSGESFDFGSADVEDIRKCIEAGNVWSDNMQIQNITDGYRFQYQRTIFDEIIKLK